MTQLLIVDPHNQRYLPTHIDRLASYLQPHDLLVINDAATLPASLSAHSARGAPIELRLLGPERAGVFRAVLFGAGDFRTRTEHRPAPPALRAGDQLTVSPELHASIVTVSELSPRLVELRFDKSDEALWTQLYALGKPIQYANQPEPLPLWSVQTLYAARPWAAELPSAGRPLSMSVFAQLARRKVQIATLTHAAGLSATGDPAIDRALPLPERYDLPLATVQAVARTHARGQRVIAAGSTVVRALESACLGQGQLSAGEAVSTLRIDASHELRVVDGLLTGIHTPEESHFDLLRAFASRELLTVSQQRALELNYQLHEFGDVSLILSGTLGSARAAA